MMKKSFLKLRYSTGESGMLVGHFGGVRVSKFYFVVIQYIILKTLDTYSNMHRHPP